MDRICALVPPHRKAISSVPTWIHTTTHCGSRGLPACVERAGARPQAQPGWGEIPLWLRCDSDEELLRRIRACLACSQKWTSLEGEAGEGRAWQPLPTVRTRLAPVLLHRLVCMCEFRRPRWRWAA